MTAYTRLHVRPLGIKSLPVRWSLPLFLALVVCLAIWQVWLTWRLMGQDRNLAAQQSRYRLEQIADLALAQLASKLGEWELSRRELESLPPASTLQANLPANGVLVLLSHQSVDLYPAKHLLFVPKPPMGGALPAAFGLRGRHKTTYYSNVGLSWTGLLTVDIYWSLTQSRGRLGFIS
jgi:hypothetical protein